MNTLLSSDRSDGRPLLVVDGLSKQYPGVTALDSVSMTVLAGEVHALVGENGAGKSTLIKILAGAQAPTGGRLVFDGREYAALTPQDSRALGISVIHQEFNLVPEMTVVENMFLGHEARTRLRTLDRRAMRRMAAQQLERVGRAVDLDARIADLTVAEQQLVEIARALLGQSRLLVMDEPSAVLAGDELHELMATVRRLQAQGVAVIYVSHRLDEIFELADRATVLKDGKVVDARPVAQLDHDTLVQLMIGRSLSGTFPPPASAPGDVVVCIRKLTVKDTLFDIDLEIRAGEVLGLGGLVGSGRTTLAHALFGVERYHGTVQVDGQQMRGRHTPAAAVKKGLTLVPEDRKEAGLVLGRTGRFNLALPNLRTASSGGFIQRSALAQTVRRLAANVELRDEYLDRDVTFLSGGNQQKVVIGKWLSEPPRLAILDEPTRGVDVGAKAEIYKQIRALADGGTAVLMISSDLIELIGMSDRIAVLHEGRLTGELSRQEATEEAVMRLATAVTTSEARR